MRLVFCWWYLYSYIIVVHDHGWAFPVWITTFSSKSYSTHGLSYHHVVLSCSYHWRPVGRHCPQLWQHVASHVVRVIWKGRIWLSRYLSTNEGWPWWKPKCKAAISTTLPLYRVVTVVLWVRVCRFHTLEKTYCDWWTTTNSGPHYMLLSARTGALDRVRVRTFVMAVSLEACLYRTMYPWGVLAYLVIACVYTHPW